MLEKYNKSSQHIISLAESLAFSYMYKEVTLTHLFLAFLKTPDSELGRLVKKGISISDLEHKYLKTNLDDHEDDFYEPINFYMEYSKELSDTLKEVERSLDKEDEVTSFHIAYYLIKNINIQYINDIGYKSKSELLDKLEKQYLPCQELEKISDLHRLGTNNLDPLIGREDIINQLIMVLSRRNKPNPLLLGEPGVGKSFIINHLAKRISENKVPALKNCAIFELDLPSTVGGTKYRGEFEEKIKKIIQQAIKSKKAILFIDEIHTIVNAGGADGAIDFSNIIKPYLSRGDIRIIGATTIDEYERSFSKDLALKRRFQTINVLENTEEETVNILNRLKHTYESYYKKKIDDDVIPYICHLAKKHLLNQSFPDKAIDILDNSLALSQETNLTRDDINNTLSYIYHINIFNSLNLNQYARKISESIKGQDLAIKKFLNSMEKSFAESKKDGCKNIILLYGPSGVGKTALVKTYTKLYYGSTDNLYEIEACQIKDSHSFNRLFINEQVYLNHKDDSPLIKHVKKYPGSLILIHDIDTLNEDVIDSLTSIFENGKSTASYGEKIDFSNVTFILTCQTKETTMDKLHNNLGFNNRSSDGYKAFEDKFKYAFLAQIDEIIEFKELDSSAINELEKIYSINNIEKTDEYREEIKKFGVRAIIKKSHQMYSFNNNQDFIEVKKDKEKAL